MSFTKIDVVLSNPREDQIVFLGINEIMNDGLWRFGSPPTFLRVYICTSALAAWLQATILAMALNDSELTSLRRLSAQFSRDWDA